MNILNVYFTEMFFIIDKHKGVVNKVGDAFMAVFGGIENDPNQAIHALQAAFDMQSKLDELNRSGQFDGLQIKIGIGVHTGKAIIGNIGSNTRLEYTTIGETVNVAARTETYTKKIKIPILITETTLRHLDPSTKAVERASREDVGESIGQALYEIIP